MQKQLFVTTSMVAAIAQATAIRESIYQTQASLFETELAQRSGWGLAQTTTKRNKGQHAQTQSEATSFSFAQVEAQQSSEMFHKCTTTFDRLKNSNDDVDAVNAAYTNNGTKFDDVNFKHGVEGDALFWVDAGEVNRDMDNMDANVQWHRVSSQHFKNKYQNPSVSFFGPNGLSSVNPTDINQGYIGNCWIQAAISAVAEHPHRIDHVFHNAEISEAGIYAMDLYSLGVLHTITVDDYLPMWGNGGPAFGNVGKDHSVWAAMTEKVFAKWYGNYEHTIAGWMKHGVAALNGSPEVESWHVDWSGNSLMTAEEIWPVIVAANDEHDIITAASNFCGNHDSTTPMSVACSHAYTVIDAFIYNGTKLLKMRNPWGSEQYSGPWSDGSSEWTAQAQQDIPDYLNNKGDGLFYIDIDSYRANFSQTTVNQDTYYWTQDYFLSLSNEEVDETGTNTHTIEVTNLTNQPQDIFVGSHTWQGRAYGWYNSDVRDCSKPRYNNHSIRDNESGSQKSFNSEAGSVWFPKQHFSAGETRTYTVTFNWDEFAAADWSVTAWGTNVEEGVAGSTRDKTVEVKYVNDDGTNRDTDNFPRLDDANRVYPVEPIIVEEGWFTPSCINLDANTNGDRDGDYCSVYLPEWCGGYDDDDFNSNTMCCTCGGGQQVDEDDEGGDEDQDKEEEEDDDKEEDDDDEEDENDDDDQDDDKEDEDEGGDDEDDTNPDSDKVRCMAGETDFCSFDMFEDNDANCNQVDGCCNIDFGRTDNWEYSCLMFMEADCGPEGEACPYDDDDFIAKEYCCLCGGGWWHDGSDDGGDEGDDKEDDKEDEEDGCPDNGATWITADIREVFETIGQDCKITFDQFSEWFGNFCDSEICDYEAVDKIFHRYEQDSSETLCLEEFAYIFYYVTTPEGAFANYAGEAEMIDQAGLTTLFDDVCMWYPPCHDNSTDTTTGLAQLQDQGGEMNSYDGYVCFCDCISADEVWFTLTDGETPMGVDFEDFTDLFWSIETGNFDMFFDEEECAENEDEDEDDDEGDSDGTGECPDFTNIDDIFAQYASAPTTNTMTDGEFDLLWTRFCECTTDNEFCTISAGFGMEVFFKLDTDSDLKVSMNEYSVLINAIESGDWSFLDDEEEWQCPEFESFAAVADYFPLYDMMEPMGSLCPHDFEALWNDFCHCTYWSQYDTTTMDAADFVYDEENPCYWGMEACETIFQGLAGDDTEIDSEEFMPFIDAVSSDDWSALWTKESDEEQTAQDIVDMYDTQTTDGVLDEDEFANCYQTFCYEACWADGASDHGEEHSCICDEVNATQAFNFFVQESSSTTGQVDADGIQAAWDMIENNDFQELLDFVNDSDEGGDEEGGDDEGSDEGGDDEGGDDEGSDEGEGDDGTETSWLDEWANGQAVRDTENMCNLDFFDKKCPESDKMMFFASHECEDYDVNIQFKVRKDIWESSSREIDTMHGVAGNYECWDHENGDCICEFKVCGYGALGIAFDGNLFDDDEGLPVVGFSWSRVEDDTMVYP